MVKTIKDTFGEIVRLRNGFYNKWQDCAQDDDYNRVIYKAKYEALDKVVELLLPSIIK